MKHFVVMRYPVLPEDEGRHHLYAVRDSRADAEAFIKDECKSYWTPRDFYICEEG